MFTLTGFKTVRREGILMQGTFAAQVNAELQVGTLEETITVTGESPTVDVSQQHRAVRRRSRHPRPDPDADSQHPVARAAAARHHVTPFVLGQYTMSVHGSASADMVIADRRHAR